MKTGRNLPVCAATGCGPELVALDPTPPGKRRRVAIAGNPNTGKTTLFNRLTGLTAKVGNFPGITVECRTGKLRLEHSGSFDLVDIPGTYSLTARSREEEIAIQALLGTAGNQEPALVILVVDATQLARNLYFVLQVIELGLPIVIALNMVDALEKEGLEVDAARLSSELGVPAVPVSAQNGAGLKDLSRVLDDAMQQRKLSPARWGWRTKDERLERVVDAVAEHVPAEWAGTDAGRRRSLATWALLSIYPDEALDDVPADLRAAVLEQRALDEPEPWIDEAIVSSRYAWIDSRLDGFLCEPRPKQISLTDRIDAILLHPLLGFGLFLMLMTVLFQSLFAWADPAIGWIEAAVAWLGDVAASLLPANLFGEFVVDGVIAGVGGVLVFLPQILLLFLFIGIMEDTGYMARVAYLMDRVMKSIGLHGRAFVPLMSGYACAVPAILSTRTMESRRDRMLTMLVVPLMTCTARLPVYGLLIAAIVPMGSSMPFMQGLLLAGMYLFSTVIALICAAVLGRTLFQGRGEPLLVEMPPYRRPHWPTVGRMLWDRCSVFVREAGSVILVCTIVIWVLLTFPRTDALAVGGDVPRRSFEVAGGAASSVVVEPPADINGTGIRASYGGQLGRLLEPALEPLGFDWQIGIGLIGAFAAREVFVSTMAIVYGVGEDADESSRALRDKLQGHRWPDGRKVFTPLVCLSLMVFFALACQCMSTLAVVRRETLTWRWPLFMFLYMNVLAWGASFVVYQGGQLLGFT